MGVCCSVTDTKQIEQEFKKKKREQVVMVFGTIQSGKSTIIKQFMDLHGHGYKNEHTIKCQYPLKSWVITEYTDQSMMKYAANTYQYFDLVNQYPSKKGYDKHNILQHMKHSIDHLGETKHFDLLFCGYLRSMQHNVSSTIMTIPLDIIKHIGLFYEYQLESFKIRCGNLKLDLWKMDISYQKHYHTLLDFITGVLFVCDMSQYNENDNTGNNKFAKGIQLFATLVNNKGLSEYIRPVVLCNKMDLFEHKFKEQSIPLNTSPCFVNAPNHLLHVVEDVKKWTRAGFESVTSRKINVYFVTAMDSAVQKVIGGISFQKVIGGMAKSGIIGLNGL